MNHSIIAPSSSARRVQCPASTTLEAFYPQDGDEDSPEAMEGVAAHWAVSEQLSGRLVEVGQIAPNGIVLDLEMVQAVDAVSDYVTRLLAPHGLRPSDGHVEQHVEIPRVHPLSWGTPDYWIRLPTGAYFILDFKYGHRFVPEFENMQMVEYLAGITDDGTNDLEHNVPIVAVVAQPRSYSSKGALREWLTDRLALRPLINRASSAAHEALGPNPRAQVGPECRDCRARHACPALQAAAYDAMDEAKVVTPLVLQPTGLSLELRLARRAQELLEARISGLEAQAMAEIKRGGRVPGWWIQHAAGREKWKVPAAQVIAVGSMMGLDLTKPVEPITPNQAREKGLDPTLVATLSTRPPGGAKLVEDDGSETRRIFDSNFRRVLEGMAQHIGFGGAAE